VWETEGSRTQLEPALVTRPCLRFYIEEVWSKNLQTKGKAVNQMVGEIRRINTWHEASDRYVKERLALDQWLGICDLGANMAEAGDFGYSMVDV